MNYSNASTYSTASGQNLQYVVMQVTLKEKFIGTGSGNLTELESCINAQASKGYRLHTGTQEYEALDVGSFGDEVTNLQERLVKCGMMKSDDVE